MTTEKGVQPKLVKIKVVRLIVVFLFRIKLKVNHKLPQKLVVKPHNS